MTVTRMGLTFIVGVVFSLVLLTACNTDVSKIRDANEAARGVNLIQIKITPIATPIAPILRAVQPYIEATIFVPSPTPTPISSPTSISTPTSSPTAFPTTVSSTIAEVNIGPFGLRDGDCARSEFADDEILELINNAVEFDNFVLLPCDGPWQFRVVSSFLVESDADYISENKFILLAMNNCKRTYTLPFTPSFKSWSLGDRTVSCIQMDPGIPHSDFGRLDNITDAYSVRVEECFNELDEFQVVEVVLCEGPWQYRVLNKLVLDIDGPFPEDLYFDAEAFNSCNRFYDYFLAPAKEHWEAGIKYILCIQER